MFRLRNATVLLLLISVFFSCTSLDDSTLAVLDGEMIPLEDFTAVTPASRFVDKSNDDIDAVVDDFLKRELFVHAAFERGYEKDSLVAERLKTTQRGIMMQYVFEKAILGSVLNDDVLREMYDRAGVEVKARHILLQFDGVARSQSTRSKAEAVRLMEDIKKRVATGESFEALAEELSEGPSASSGGDLGWFGWGRMVGPFQEAAFALKPGELSGVVETMFGLHLIKVEDRREMNRGSFEEEKPRLMQQARKAMEGEIRMKADGFVANIKKEAGFELYKDNISVFIKVYNGSDLQNKPLDVVLESLTFAPPLLTLNGEEKNYRWVLDQLRAIPKAQRPVFSSENHLISILDQLVFQSLVIDYGYAQQYDQDEAFKEKTRGLAENLVYSTFMEKEVTNQAQPSDEDLKSYYEKHKKDKYLDKQKVSVKEIFVKDSLLAVDLKKRLNAGEEIGFLASRFSERKTGKDNEGSLPPFQEGRYGEMGKAAFTMQPGDVSEPIQLGNGYSIIQLEEIIPEQPRPFARVKSRIKNELTNDMRKRRGEELFKELKKEFSVKINYSAVHDFYNQELKAVEE
ncbi:MAG: peptidylprolyl isomerase [Candidatus Marinimicrobia bacterium]|nr:peptidylprolyl isomerase [Candidatus Neomarinimicrobiota bacterium]MCF7903870.1 peptidylprolyl isomerase [Candidatus Neomarinimicrobiota bacterium]